MLLSIGQMANLSNTTTQTLRHYDKIGLLEPNGINQKNGYRLYTLDQLHTMNIISFLKYTGMSLNEIKSFLHNQTSEEMIRILEEQSSQLREKIKILEKINTEINLKTHILKDYLASPDPYRIEIKDIEDRYFLKLEIENDKLGNSYMVYVNQLLKEHNHQGVTFSDTGLIIPQKNILKKAYSSYKYLFISVPSSYPSATKIPGSKYATIKHLGEYSKCHISLGKLMDFIEQNNYLVIGDAIEHSVIDFCLTQDKDALVTELQIPIKTPWPYPYSKDYHYVRR